MLISDFKSTLCNLSKSFPKVWSSLCKLSKTVFVNQSSHCKSSKTVLEIKSTLCNLSVSTKKKKRRHLPMIPLLIVFNYIQSYLSSVVLVFRSYF